MTLVAGSGFGITSDEITAAVDTTWPVVWSSPGSLGTVPWSVVTAESVTGGSSLRSGSISDNQSTSVKGVFHTDVPSTLSFSWRASSESVNYDYIYLIVDGASQADVGAYYDDDWELVGDFTYRCGGSTGWVTKTYDLDAGDHTIEFVYRKDSSVSKNEDCGWIDNVQITPCETVSVALELNGGALPEGTAAELAATTGRAYGTLPTPTREGFHFTGWYTAAEGGTAVTATSVVAAGTTAIYAQWTPFFAVTLDAQGGTVDPATLTVYAGGMFGTLPTPTKTDCRFLGWFTAAGGTQVTATSVVAAGTTAIYAQWLEQTTVTFDAQGGTVEPATLRGFPGDALGTLPTPTKEGAFFEGWFTAATGGTAVTAATTYATDLTTVYAQWAALAAVENLTAAAQVNPGRIELAWDYADFEGTFEVQRWTGSGTPTTVATLPASARSYTDTTCAAGTTYNYRVRAISAAAETGVWRTVTGARDALREALDTVYDVTYTSPGTSWTVVSYSGSVGGTCAKSGAIGDSQTTLIQGTFTIPGPAGLAFTWQVSSESGYDKLSCTVNGTTIAGPISGTSMSALTAVTNTTALAAAGTYTVVWKYVKDGSQSSGSDCGWLDNVQIIPYVETTVTLDPNGGDLPEGSAATLTGFAHKTTFGTLPTPTREGFHFMGWFTAAEGGTAVTATTTLTEAVTTVYAQWTPLFAVTLDAHGGDLPEGAAATVTVYAGGTYGTLPTPAKTDCRFLGWYTAAEGGTKVTATTTVTAGTTALFAQWLEQTTVTLDAQGGTVEPATLRGFPGDALGTLPTPTREGFHFLGWFTAAEGGTAVTAATKYATDLTTVYARWVPTFAVTLDAQGGTVEPAAVAVYAGGTYGTLPTPAKTDCRFLGWFTAAAGGDKVTDTATVTEEVTTLYAHWMERPVISDLVCQQRYPWNGLVDITFTVRGVTQEAIDTDHDEVMITKFVFSTTNHTAGAAQELRMQTFTEADGTKVNLRSVAVTNGTYHYVWNAAADLRGADALRYGEVRSTVTTERKLQGVQLWAGGPYWAECNVGAEEPEEFGYYFWWGDTVGYVPDATGTKWVRSDGTSDEGFDFSTANRAAMVTVGMTTNQLFEAGITTSATGGVLKPEYDAATAHWGPNWRMPTHAELDALQSKTTYRTVTRNGVRGYLRTGKEAGYTDKSIFIPKAGNSGNLQTSHGANQDDACIYLWSSTPYPSGNNGAYRRYWGWDVSMDNEETVGARHIGQSVRPVFAR